MAAEETKEKQAEKPAVEKQTNCPSCNKPIKKIRRYYRNGKYFCTKKCWKKSTEPKKEEKE